MIFLIRTDSSISMGTGHLMRCLTLAEALDKKGSEIHFICRDLEGNLSHIVKEQGYILHLLPASKENFKPQPDDTVHASWLEVSWHQDLQETKKIAASVKKKFDWLIVDSYPLDYRWEEKMRDLADRIMVIDDIADRRHDCDLLLDQNYFEQSEKRYNNLIPGSCSKVLGPKYALLRSEFRQAKKFCRMRGNEITRILVYFGGSDKINLTGMALEALSSIELEHIEVDVVVGPHNPNLKKLQKQVKERLRSRLHIQPKTFVELLLRADLCIGAGGTTTWERLCFKCPALIITTALNQETLTFELDKTDSLGWIGTKDTVTAEKIKTAIIKELSRVESVNYLTKQTQVDGCGAVRVAEILMPSSDKTLRLRRTMISDMETYFSWVNDPKVRRSAFNAANIPWETHKDWFEKKIYSKKTAMWVLEILQGLPVGQIRFDIKNNTADIDYNLDSFVCGRGWTKRLLALGIKTFKENNEQIPLQAEVKNENHQSLRLFQRIGFMGKSRGEGNCFSIVVISDSDSWLNDYLPYLIITWLEQGHRVLWVHNPENAVTADFCFLLGCGQLVSNEILALFSQNLVVHESDLPLGKGWSPLTWQIIEGKNTIPVSLIEAAEKVDSGDIYLQRYIHFKGNELVDDLRKKQAEKTMELCRCFVDNYPEILGHRIPQEGKETFYSKRTPENSQIDLDLSIREQFNLLRVVDNEKYPVWFKINGQKYLLKVEKCF